MINRIIPFLLLQNKGLVKSIKFKNYTYVGDPINAVKIFNEKEVDELIFLDISATKDKKEPDYELIKNISEECFMPLCYGGGINSIEQIRKITKLGVEKVSINSFAAQTPDFIKKASEIFGSSTIVVSIDVKKNIFGKQTVYSISGSKNTGIEPVEYAILMEKMGAGELMITSIDKDGTQSGYDFDLIKRVSESVSIPVIASGGAGTIQHFREAIHTSNAMAVAAGSMFVFHGNRRAVLISYPSQKEILEILAK